MLKRYWERFYDGLQRRVQKMVFFPADVHHAVQLSERGTAETYELPDSPLLKKDPRLPNRGTLPDPTAYRYNDMTGLSGLGLIKTRDGRYVYHPDLRLSMADIRKIRKRFSWTFDPQEEVSTTATYFGHTLPNNYFHFITDFVAPYLFYRRQKKSIHVVFGFQINEWQEDILHHFGISDYTTSKRGGNFLIKDLIILPRANYKRSHCEDFRIFRSNFFQILVEEAFQRLSGKKSHGFKRIYIHRPGNYRRLENERELMERLRPLGFVTIDSAELNFEEKLRTFSEVEIVVAPHGAGTTNMIFTPSGASLVDIMPGDYASGVFMMMGLPGNHRYAYVIGSPLSAKAESFRVSIEEVLHQIELLLQQGTKRVA